MFCLLVSVAGLYVASFSGWRLRWFPGVFGFRVVFRLLDWFGLGLVLSLFWFGVICWCLLVVLLDW